MSMLNRKIDLLTNRALNPKIQYNDPQISADNAIFIDEITAGIIGNKSQLPFNPGFEIHPYKGILHFSQQEKILIGTFPPISYLIDTINNRKPGLDLKQLQQPTPPHQQIQAPSIPFFHGNISALWSVFLTTKEFNELNSFLPENRHGSKNYLIQKLNDLSIYYDDIIISTQRKLGIVDQNTKNLGYTYEDINLKNICTDKNLIINVISNQNLKVICFTNGATFRTNGLQIYTQPARAGLVRTNSCDALSLFLRGCQDLGLTIEMQCLPHFSWMPIEATKQAQRSTKLIFELRIKKGTNCTHPELQHFKKKEFTVITPFSPAAHGTIEYHPVVSSYRLINGNVSITTILKDVYGKFRNNIYNGLYNYNI
jgi:hypothetical protein